MHNHDERWSAHRKALTQAGRKQREWTTRRDKAIRQAHDDGASLRDIGGWVGLHFTSVANIVNRQTDR